MVLFNSAVLLISLYLILSIVTYLMFAWDKRAAQRGRSRTSEKTLHVFSLLGGWPGALLAQRTLKHKSRKQPFKLILWVSITLNIGCLVWLVYGNWKPV